MSHRIHGEWDLKMLLCRKSLGDVGEYNMGGALSLVQCSYLVTQQIPNLNVRYSGSKCFWCLCKEKAQPGTTCLFFPHQEKFPLDQRLISGGRMVHTLCLVPFFIWPPSISLICSALCSFSCPQSLAGEFLLYALPKAGEEW